MSRRVLRLFGAVRQPGTTMANTELISRLIATEEYLALKNLTPEFNLFALLEDALREPAWSRIFSGILDSTLPHGLGDAAFRQWLTLVDEESGNTGTSVPASFLNLPRGSIIRTSCEYSTPAGRRVDIVVRILDSKHRLFAVVGIENKLGSREQPSQIADYQAALSEVFPEANRLIIYLTPDGRAPETSDKHSTCPCVSTSYGTMVGICRKLGNNATTNPNVRALLKSLGNEIKATVLGDDKMKRDAKALIGKLWLDPSHRQALRLIIECVPTPRKIWESGLVKRIEPPAKAFGMLVDDHCIEFYPDRNASPHEIKIWCGGEIAKTFDRLGFHFCYMLHCRERNPDIGSEFSLRLMAWCESARGSRCLKDLELEGTLPPSGSRRHWSSWQNIWTGASYVLQDLDTGDFNALARLVLDGAQQTYPVIANKLAARSK